MKVAIVDFDGTLFLGETIPFLLKFYQRQRPKSYSRLRLIWLYLKLLSILLSYKLNIGKYKDKERFRARATQLFLGLFHGCASSELIDFFHGAAREMTASLNHPLMEELSDLKAKGYYVLMLSGCFDTLLYEFDFQQLFDKYLCTSLTLDPLFNANQPLEIVSGNQKEKALNAWLQGHEVNWLYSRAYADSYYDMPILTRVGIPVVVRPDKALLRMASANQWRIFGA